MFQQISICMNKLALADSSNQLLEPDLFEQIVILIVKINNLFLHTVKVHVLSGAALYHDVILNQEYNEISHVLNHYVTFVDLDDVDVTPNEPQTAESCEPKQNKMSV